MQFFKNLYVILVAYFLPLSVWAQAPLPAVDANSLFAQDSKPVQLMTSFHWAIMSISTIAGIAMLIIAGNWATRGEWGKAGAGLVGSVICAIGAYLVNYVRG